MKTRNTCSDDLEATDMEELQPIVDRDVIRVRLEVGVEVTAAVERKDCESIGVTLILTVPVVRNWQKQ